MFLIVLTLMGSGNKVAIVLSVALPVLIAASIAFGFPPEARESKMNCLA
jgi:hypothetical protein